MTKNHIALFSMLTFLTLFSSCEKVIDLDLNTSSSQIVIQGNVYDQAGPYTVKLSKSVNFDESSSYPAVTGATVTISDDAGNAEILSGDSSGIYSTSQLQGVPGRTYTLEVETGGQTYTASSKMPPAVEIDTLYEEQSDYSGYRQLSFQYKDPADIKNYYRILDFVNDTIQNYFITENDLISEGKLISGTLLYDSEDLKSGDSYTLWLECIDEGVYDYFYTASLNGGDSTTSPANPTSNISNGALGYFNACAVRKKSFIVP
jgi:hypothetical protein